jgi:hypothetical protein
MELGREAAQHVSATFIKPIRLEFEKVQMLLLLPMRPVEHLALWAFCVPCLPSRPCRHSDLTL